MKRLTLTMLAFGATVLGGQAMAQPVSELLEDVSGNQCVEALQSCKGDGVGARWSEARVDCAPLRTCKRECRQGKRSSRQDNRAEKQACVASCDGKRGKAKRACKKACRKAKRSANKGARKSARECKQVCRDEYKTPECRDARRKLSGALLSCARKVGPPCIREAEKLGK